MTTSEVQRGTAPKDVRRPHIEIRPLRSGGHRVVFLYTYKQEFASAARAIKIRGHMLFGKNPLPGKWDYLAFYADIRTYDAETYANYAMLVRDFYASDIQAKFNALFPDLDCAAIPSAIHNPNSYMEAQRPAVDALIAKYRDTTSPLEFYGSKHMAEGVAMALSAMAHHEHKGVIIADEQGMAKTVQAVVAAIEGGKKRVLVVSPKTARTATWPEEIAKVKPDAKVFLGSFEWLGPPDKEWVLISWDHLRRFDGAEQIIAGQKMIADAQASDEYADQAKVEAGRLLIAQGREKIKVLATGFDLLIADEAHRAQTEDSLRSTGLEAFAACIADIILLTGTPVPKRPENAFNLLKLVNHPLAKEPEAFHARYNSKALKTLTPDEKAQRLDELHSLLRDVYIRREKSQTNLPPKTRRAVNLRLSEEDKQRIDKMWEAFCEEPDNKEKMKKPTYPLDTVMAGKYHEFTSLVKAPYVAEDVEDLVAAGKKVVVFTGYTTVFDYFMKRFGRSAVGIDGRHTPEEREMAKRRFQTDDGVTEFVGNFIAAGESITLTASSDEFFNDITNVPKDMLQAEDRVHRGGQTQICETRYYNADTEDDLKRFNRFINDKETVQSITNRRNADGTINDAKWTGDIAGTEAAKQRRLTKSAFDWADAGEEPPKVVKPRETLATMSPHKRGMIQTYQAKQKAKKQGARVATDDAGISRQLQAVLPFQGSPKSADFIRSLVKWNRDGRAFTSGQKNAAIHLLGRNIHRLLGVQ